MEELIKEFQEKGDKLTSSEQLNASLVALVDLLVDKGIITYEEYIQKTLKGFEEKIQENEASE